MPGEMQRADKAYLNHVYKIQVLNAATGKYLELLPAFGFTQVPDYEAFILQVKEHDLKTALEKANAPFEGLD